MLQPRLVGAVEPRSGVGREVRGTTQRRIWWIAVDEIACGGDVARRLEGPPDQADPAAR